jgi:hypothetical protein
MDESAQSLEPATREKEHEVMTTRRVLLTLLTGATAAFLGCQENPPLAVGPGGLSPEASLGSTLQNAGLLTCSPVPSDSVSQAVGPQGGTLVVGLHSLVVPEGALDSVVVITAVAPSDTVNRVQFQPGGLVFGQPASLRMSYANCNLLGSLLPKRVAYVDDALEILYFLLSVDNPPTQTVTGWVEHFSEYAIAW